MALRGSQLARAYAGAPIDDAMQDAETDYDETDSSDGGMQLDVISANGEVPLLETLDPPSSIPSEFQVELTTRAPDARSYGTGIQPQAAEYPTQGLTHPAMGNSRASEGRREETWVRSRADGHPTQAFMRPVSVSDRRPSPENTRTLMSEEEHAALTVLNDDELLMMYALKSGHTIPQTRRRFQAMFLARGDNDIEEELFSGRFVIPETRADSVPGLLNLALTTDALGINNTKAYCVPARWSQRLDDPYDRQGERGWISPESGTVAIRRLGQSK